MFVCGGRNSQYFHNFGGNHFGDQDRDEIIHITFIQTFKAV
jgi:hypothetical protein